MSILPLALLLFSLKMALGFYGPTLQNHPPESAPLLSLTTLKKYYNAALFYRIHSLELEHLGDMNGERRSLKHYDPSDLKKWFQSIDVLSSQPDLLPFLATFYYGPSPPLKETCITFLETHCDHNPKAKWRWLAHALTLENNPAKALNISKKLAAYGKTYTLPLWVKDAEARAHSRQGNHNGARLLFQAILDDPNNTLSPEEIHFLESILHSLKSYFSSFR